MLAALVPPLVISSLPHSHSVLQCMVTGRLVAMTKPAARLLDLCAHSCLASRNTAVLGPGTFKSTLPADLQKLSALTALHLEGSGFHGTLPAAWGATGFQELKELYLGHNQISGSLPGDWGSHSRCTLSSGGCCARLADRQGRSVHPLSSMRLASLRV